MYLVYFILWIIFNGKITLEICIFGLVIAALVFAFTCKFMDYSMKANFSVIHMILSEREELEPALVSFRSDMKSPTGRAFLANAITLTPGTITVTLEDSEYLVHCLDKSLAVGMDDSVFVEMLSELEQD